MHLRVKVDEIDPQEEEAIEQEAIAAADHHNLPANQTTETITSNTIIHPPIITPTAMHHQTQQHHLTVIHPLILINL